KAGRARRAQDGAAQARDAVDLGEREPGRVASQKALVAGMNAPHFVIARHARHRDRAHGRIHSGRVAARGQDSDPHDGYEVATQISDTQSWIFAGAYTQPPEIPRRPSALPLAHGLR